MRTTAPTVTSSALAGLRVRLAADVPDGERLVPAGRLAEGMQVRLGRKLFTVEEVGAAFQPGAVSVVFSDGTRLAHVGARDRFTVVG